MPKLMLTVLAGLAAGIGIAAWVVGSPDRRTADAGPGATEFDTQAGVEERLLALETAVSTERQARQLIEDELLALYEALESLEGEAGPPSPTTANEPGTGPEPRARQFGGRGGLDGDDTRLRALIEAGFPESRAGWILNRESELRMQAIRERFEAMQSGEPAAARGRFSGLASSLRDELGDADYEKYLEAGNRSTSVGIRDVLQSSPALAAGLQAGDRITHYDGERVFSSFDLTRQALRGEPGENVVVEIVRDGAPMQVVLPRGPLGITTGRQR